MSGDANKNGTSTLERLRALDTATLHESGAQATMRPEIRMLSGDLYALFTNKHAKAQTRGLVPGGDPAVLADRYHALLRGDLLIRLLMRVREAPTEREIEVRARAATETLMALPLLESLKSKTRYR